MAHVRLLFALAAAAGQIACTTPPPMGEAAAAPPWQARLGGDAMVLLGEVHDNAEQHRLRLEVLGRAIAAGWRPAIVMEQFDRERQADLDRARRERPRDAQHVIERATTPPARPGGGWNWDFYRPFVALALDHDLPLVAGNLSSADAAKIVRGGYAAVFDEAATRAVGLDRPVDPEWQRAQEREIDAGHCGALPTTMWPRMASAQFARDAVLADALRRHGGRGAVLLAGNGHVRKDIGVPRWLPHGRVWSVGYLEAGDGHTPEHAFDAVVRTKPVERGDPCAAFRNRAPSPSARAVDVDALWDHERPELSEQRFRAALDGASADEQRILQTQIARTYGMRREFAKAREVLATLEPTLASASAEVRVRYFLELGRSYRSPLHPSELRAPAAVEQARASFLRAFELAQQARLDSLAIDALHMMPFVEVDADRQAEWNEKALRYLAQSTQADAKAWEGPLRNNVGHAKRLRGDYEGALRDFALSRAAYERAGRVNDVRIADWMVARTYRDQKRYEEALAMQLALERAWEAEKSVDPHVLQELEHLYRALGQEERAQHYAAKRKAAQR